MSADIAAPRSNAAITLEVVSVVLFTFLAYLTIGIPLAVLPGYVHGDLGYGSVLAGLVISTQYLATLLTRPYAGKVIDTLGPKRAVLYGMCGCAVSGLCMLLSASTQALPLLSLGSLLLGRLILGTAESLVGSGSISWGIDRVGAGHTAKVISWNGIASYGALAVGAPFGAVLAQHFGLAGMALAVTLLGILGFALAWPRRPAAVVHGERLPFHHVLGRVAPHGSGLALGGIGFGCIATFITLYYRSRGWDGAVYCLSAFGACFIGARLLFANAINRHGGFLVAIVCLSVETLGLLLLWQAAAPWSAFAGAALTGFGFSLVFPALGVEAVRLVPASSRGAALGAYSLFIDVSLGITGPLAGAIASGWGFRSIFLFAATAALLGLGLSLWLQRRH